MSDKDNKILIQLSDGSEIETDILQIQNSGQTDHMDRPIWVDEHGNVWVDVNMNDRNPSLHDTCMRGEPNCPIDYIWEENDDLFSEKELYVYLGGLK